MVTGFGGDELGNSLSSARAERLLTTRRRPHWRDLLVIGLAASPRALRSEVHRRRAYADRGEVPWLTDEGFRLLARAAGESDGAIPLGWEAKLRRWIWTSRYFRICQESFRVLGAFHDVDVVHPFADGRVLDSLGRPGDFAALATAPTSCVRSSGPSCRPS